MPKTEPYVVGLAKVAESVTTAPSIHVLPPDMCFRVMVVETVKGGSDVSTSDGVFSTRTAAPMTGWTLPSRIARLQHARRCRTIFSVER